MTAGLKNTSCSFFIGAIAAFLTVSAAEAAWIHDKTNGQSLVFKDEKSGKSETLKTEVTSPLFVAMLTDPESGTPYALYEGKTCPKCGPENTSLFLQRIDGRSKATSFVYPGRIVDPKKNATVYTGRLFYGNCLPSVKQGVVTHQSEAVDRRGTQKSVVIAEPGPQYVYEVLLERRLPALKTTLDLVKRKSCVEVAGRNRSVLKRPLDLTPKKGLDDEEVEDEDKSGDEGDKKNSD